jgi:excinuclease ABC subunit B
LRIIDPTGIDESDDVILSETEWNEESSDDSLVTSNSAELGTNFGIRPMEPLQPSNFRRQLHKARVATNEVGHNRAASTPSKSSSKLADLERQMKEAAARLDFEEAARIRDIIRSLDA